MSGTARALLLDLDGTLADSLGPLRRAYGAFLDGFGLRGSDGEFQSLNGPPMPRVIELLKKRHGLPGSPAELLARYDALLAEVHGTALPAFGAEAVLARAREAGWAVAVVTSARREPATAWLSRNGLAVDHVVGGDDVVRGKPSPDPYLAALAALSALAAQSLAVEDSRSGATAAVAAGVPTCAIAHPDDRDAWPSPIRFVDRLADVAALL